MRLSDIYEDGTPVTHIDTRARGVLVLAPPAPWWPDAWLWRLVRWDQGVQSWHTPNELELLEDR